MQAGIQHQVITITLHGLLANRVQQLRAYAAALQLGTDHQVIDIDETPVEQVFQLAVTGQADQALALLRGQQTVALLRLPNQLRHIAVLVIEVRAQHAHQRKAGRQGLRVVEVLKGVRHVRCPP